MADEFRIELDAASVIDRLRNRLPDLTKQEVLTGMRQVAGQLENLVITNIQQMLNGGHSATRAPHLHLIDSILTRVFEVGPSTIVTEIGYDISATPYARILEMGGRTSPHLIKPKRASMLAFPTSTLREFNIGETTHEEFVFAFQVHHPGSRIVPYHYISNAVAVYASQFQNDIGLAVAAAIVRSGLSR